MTKRLFSLLIAICVAAALLSTPSLAAGCTEPADNGSIPTGHNYQNGVCRNCGAAAPIYELVTSEDMLVPGDKYIIGTIGEGFLGLRNDRKAVNGSVVMPFDQAYWEQVGRETRTIRLASAEEDKCVKYVAEFTLGLWKPLDDDLELPGDAVLYSLISDTNYVFSLYNGVHLNYMEEPSVKYPLGITIEPYDAENDRGGGATIRSWDYDKDGHGTWSSPLYIPAEADAFVLGETPHVMLFRLKHVHTLEHIPGAEATCETEGTREHWYCTGCYRFFYDAGATRELNQGDIPLAALGHDWLAEWESSPNGHWHKCSRCDETTGFETHTEEWKYDEVEHWQACAVCGFAGEKSIHSYQFTERVEPTADQTGYELYECACGSRRMELLPIVTHVHTMEHVPGAEPTCENIGAREYWYCTSCYKFFHDAEGTRELNQGDIPLPALGHDWQEKWESSPNGHWHKCSRCDEISECELHTFVDYLVEPDCEHGGILRSTCTVCGYEETTEILPRHLLVEHDFEKPTCTSYGMAKHSECTRCGKLFDENGDETTAERLRIPMLMHIEYTESTVVTEPTCTHEGLRTETTKCESCGQTLYTREVVLPRLEHRFEAVDDIEATCTEAGVRAHWECTLCGALLAEPAVLYGPTAPLDRSLMAQVMAELMGWTYEGAEQAFDDVPLDHPYYAAIMACVGNGLVNGVAEGTFAPDRPITRAELAMMLYCLAGEPALDGEATPRDVPQAAWYHDCCTYACAHGWMDIDDNNWFHPVEQALLGDVNLARALNRNIAVVEATAAELTIPALGHLPGGDWQSDLSGHWHECARCGEKLDEAAHTWGGWTVAIPAQNGQDGIRHHTCEVCGFMEREVIPADTDELVCITDIAVNAETGGLEVSFDVCTEQVATFEALAAYYDESGCFLGVEMVTLTEGSLTASFDNEAGGTYVVMAVDSTSWQPLMEQVGQE